MSQSETTSSSGLPESALELEPCPALELEPSPALVLEPSSKLALPSGSFTSSHLWSSKVVLINTFLIQVAVDRYHLLSKSEYTNMSIASLLRINLNNKIKQPANHVQHAHLLYITRMMMQQIQIKAHSPHKLHNSMHILYITRLMMKQI